MTTNLHGVLATKWRKTIWTLPKASLKEKLSRTGDWANIQVAARLPRRLRYWAIIHELAQAVAEHENVPGMKLDEILRRLDK